MFLAQWSFDMQYGARQETMSMVKEFGSAIEKLPGWRSKKTRVLWGSIGAPESRVVIEHEFASLSDLEASWTAIQGSQDFFRNMVTQMRTVIVSGTPRWEVYRVLD